MRARLYAADSSASREVELQLLPGGRLQVAGVGSWPLEQLEIAARIPGCAAVVELPAGQRLEIDDADMFYAQLGGGGRLFWLESRWLAALLSIVVAVGAITWFGTRGLPAIVAVIADALPAETQTFIGREALRAMDASIFEPSTLDAARQGELRALFGEVTEAISPGLPMRIEFRAAPDIGPNAFALPSGIVVLTDELAGLAADDEELAAVLAHEAGHVVRHHALRRLLQNSLLAAVVISLTGDLGSAANLAAALPVLLLDAAYSRDFEREADAVAFDYALAQGLDPEALGRLLIRIDELRRSRPGAVTLLDSHPAAQERLAAARAAAAGR
ncbi:MAG: peptidase M48 Ste24p [Gammaproteobacteria bacterium]|nr:MAG: peptidase M48 Ste24p [Gammaproteobacteria bacterium]